MLVDSLDDHRLRIFNDIGEITFFKNHLLELNAIRYMRKKKSLLTLRNRWLMLQWLVQFSCLQVDLRHEL